MSVTGRSESGTPASHLLKGGLVHHPVQIAGPGARGQTHGCPGHSPPDHKAQGEPPRLPSRANRNGQARPGRRLVTERLAPRSPAVMKTKSFYECPGRSQAPSWSVSQGFGAGTHSSSRTPGSRTPWAPHRWELGAALGDTLSYSDNRSNSAPFPHCPAFPEDVCPVMGQEQSHFRREQGDQRPL